MSSQAEEVRVEAVLESIHNFDSGVGSTDHFPDIFLPFKFKAYSFERSNYRSVKLNQLNLKMVMSEALYVYSVLTIGSLHVMFKLSQSFVESPSSFD